MLSLMTIAGGVAFILFGIRFLRKGLDRLFGDRLASVLRRLAGDRWRAAGAGLATSLAAPSSTAMSLLAVQSVRAGDLPARRMIPVLLGADVGITVMVILIALRLEALSPVLILFGVLLFQFMRSRTLRGVGQVLLAIAFILMGVGTISTAARAIEPNGDLGELLAIAAKYPWLLAAVAAVLAVALQSSTAAIGLAIGLSQGITQTGMGDTDPLKLAVPIVAGANVGVALTLLTAGWSDRSSRRLGVANLVSKGTIAVVFLVSLSAIIGGLNALPLTLEGRIAVTHTGFNLIMAAAFLPWTDTLYDIIKRLIPDLEGGPPSTGTPRFIQSDHVSGASVALGQSRQEIVRLSSIVRSMLDEAWQALSARNEPAARRVQTRDDDVDALHHHIKSYLAHLNPEEDVEFQIEMVMQQLSYLNQLETIADTVDKGIAELAVRRHRQHVWFTEDGWDELDGLYKHVAENLLIAETAFSTQEVSMAQRLIDHKRLINQRERDLRLRHFGRLRDGVELSHESSALHLELLGYLKAINSCVTHVAYAICDGQASTKHPSTASH
ncbi:MAG: Na/Pi cotransporter family protein [Planctomycetota bacterium]